MLQWIRTGDRGQIRGRSFYLMFTPSYCVLEVYFHWHKATTTWR